MSLGLETFRAGQGDRLILNNQMDQATGVVKAQLPFFGSRRQLLQARQRQVRHPGPARPERPVQVGVLERPRQGRGPAHRRQCAAQGGPAEQLGAHLEADERQAGQARARQCSAHPQGCDEGQRAGDEAIHPGPRRAQPVAHVRRRHPRTCQDTDVGDAKLQTMFRRAVKSDPDFARQALTPQKLQDIARAHHREVRAPDREQFPRAAPGAVVVHPEGASRHAASRPAQLLQPDVGPAHPHRGPGP